jgi:hypothetical protein
MLHSEQRGSLFMICQQEAAVISSSSHLFSAAVSATLEQSMFPYITHVKYKSDRKCQQKF